MEAHRAQIPLARHARNFTRVPNSLNLAFLLSLSVVQIHAQVKTGDILGVVADNSGARIAGAMVTLRNPDTNDTRAARTDATGNYLFTLLPPGRYSLRTEKPGFRTTSVENVQLSVGDRLSLDTV